MDWAHRYRILTAIFEFKKKNKKITYTHYDWTLSKLFFFYTIPKCNFRTLKLHCVCTWFRWSRNALESAHYQIWKLQENIKRLRATTDQNSLSMSSSLGIESDLIRELNFSEIMKWWLFLFFFIWFFRRSIRWHDLVFHYIIFYCVKLLKPSEVKNNLTCLKIDKWPPHLCCPNPLLARGHNTCESGTAVRSRRRENFSFGSVFPIEPLHLTARHAKCGIWVSLTTTRDVGPFNLISSFPNPNNLNNRQKNKSKKKT